MKTSKCWGRVDIPVAKSLRSVKLSLVADVLSQLSSAKYAGSCLEFVLLLFLLVVGRCIEKGVGSD